MLPYERPPMTANDQRRAVWQQVNSKKLQVSKTVQTLALAEQVPHFGPSVVSVRWYAPDKRRRDADSLGPFCKAALDGLVKAGVFDDDHSDYITEVRLAVDKTQTKNPRIEILIREE